MPQPQHRTRTQTRVVTSLGTTWVTDLRSPTWTEADPTVLVVAGQHGDEPAGIVAAGILANYATATAGRLVIVSPANPAAAATWNRYSPVAGEDDMNRCWRMPASHRDHTCETAAHARALWDVILACEPGVVLDLHESSEGVGLAPVGLRENEIAWAIVDPNASLVRDAHDLGLLSVEKRIAGALTSELWTAGVRSIAVETRMGPPLVERVRAHLEVVRGACNRTGVSYEHDPRFVAARCGVAS